MIGHRTVAALSFVLIGLATSVAAADDEAEALFRHGKELMAAGRYAEACEKLEKSQAKESAIGTLGLLAACYEGVGRLATALRAFNQVEELARRANDSRASFAHDRAAALLPRVPKLVVASTANEPGLAVTLDGTPLERLGEAQLVDPGEHEVSASAPSKREYQTRVAVRAGETIRVDIPALVDASAPASEAPQAPPPPARESNAPPPTGSNALRTAGFVTGAVGIAGIGAGAVLGLLASARYSDTKDVRANCEAQSKLDTTSCPEADTEYDGAKGLAAGSTVAFIAGGALTAVGVGLVLFSGRSILQPSGVARVWIAPAPSRDGFAATAAGRF